MFGRLLSNLSSALKGGSDRTTTDARPFILDSGGIQSFSAARTPKDHCLVVWENGGSLWSASLNAHGAPALTNFAITTGSRPCLAFSPKGIGILLWRSEAGGRGSILGSTIDPSGGLDPEWQVLDARGEITHLQLAVDRRGGAMALWVQEELGLWQVRVQAYDGRQRRWEEASVPLGSPSAFPLHPSLVSNPTGAAMAIWNLEHAGVAGPCVFSFWPAERLWSDTPIRIAAGTASEVTAAMDGQGNALCAWIQTTPGRQAVLEASRFIMSTSEWQPPLPIATAPDLRHLRLSLEGGGAGMLAWRQTETSGTTSTLGKGYAQGRWEPQNLVLDSGLHRLCDHALATGSDWSASLLLQESGAPRVRPTRSFQLQPPQELPWIDRGRPGSPRLLQVGKGLIAFWISSGNPESQLLAARVL